MPYAIRKIPLNWYRYDVQFSLNLLHSYVQSVEEQISKSIEEFRASHELQVNDIQEALEEDWFEPGMVVTRQNLDSDSYDLENIFQEHFPHVQRTSALITLCSFLEYELNGLCQLFTIHQKLKVSLTDIQGRGIELAMLFLERIVGLKIDKERGAWQEVKNIQELRNTIVHANGKLKGRSGEQKNIAKYVKKSEYLTGDNEIKILEGYLFNVLETFGCQFQEIDEAIASSFQSS